MSRLVVPRVVFDGGDLRGGDQTFDAVDLDVGLAVAFDLGQREQVRHALHFMALEEALAINAVRSPDDGAGSALQVLDHPGTDLLEVLRKVELGVAVRLRPERLVGL